MGAFKRMGFVAAVMALVLVFSAQAWGRGLKTYGKGYRFDKNSWICVHIEGEPYERGFQHGYLVASELKEVMRTIPTLTLNRGF